MFSVVIPVYNHVRYLREAVSSALRSYLVKEVLLADDGSKDGSADLCVELALEFPQRVFDCSDKPSINSGAHNRLNQLCTLSRQPWIRVLNSDDFFLPGSFETICLLASTQQANLISGSMLICDETSQIKGTKRGVFDPEYPLPIKLEPKPLMYNEEVRRFLLNQNFIATTSNMAFTRDLFNRIGGFRDFRYAHDLDFALRATMHGVAIHTASFMVTYRSHSSNTISELSPHMDGEILRLYSSFLHDFREVEEDSEVVFLLKHNRHIDPFPPTPRRYKNQGTGNQTANTCEFSDNFPRYALPIALLALSSLSYDFVIISDKLIDTIWPLPSEDVSGLASKRVEFNIQKELVEKGKYLRGRIIRCPRREGKKNEGRPEHLRYLNGPEVRFDGADVLIGKNEKRKEKICPTLTKQLGETLAPNLDDIRPVVYVMPIFLAVGGVERNTIEVIRHLQDRYRFVVITSERLSESQGSLHWQLYEMGIPVLDLAEIADSNHHLYLLSVLADIAPPDLVWICNGSPWLVENSAKLRRLFADIPIIDQEVYDTKEGWINHYHKKGIQSFDRFIAINLKIKEAFMKRFMIPSHRVELIYSMLPEEKVLKARKIQEQKGSFREKIGISKEFSQVFIFIGRLTDQKKPLSFLEIAKNAMKKHKKCFFVLVGDGEVSSRCDKFIKTEKLNNIMRIPYHPDTPELDAIADGMIITSVYEGLPIAMLEALGVGIPVLATDVGDIRLVLEKYGSGQIFDNVNLMENAEGASASFDEFLINLPNLKKAAFESRDEIISEFGTQKISRQYDHLFGSAMNACKKKPI